MLSVGFDPSFIDTLVRVENNKGELVSSLPKIGHHHRNNTITRVAGGNGVNISAILTKLNVEHTLVVPCNDEFSTLLQKRGIKNIIPIHDKINESVGLTLKDGELQFNSAKNHLSKYDWNTQIHNYWINSPLLVFTNWGLNLTSPEWVACQWLSACGLSLEEINETRDILNLALETDGCRRNIVLEPGSIKNHPKKEFLYSILKNMSEDTFNNKYAVFSANEEEIDEFQYLKFHQFIFHTSDKVTITIQSEPISFTVDPLKCAPQTFVGAGDAFMAGLIKTILSDNLDIPFAIETAQKFLCNSL